MEVKVKNRDYQGPVGYFLGVGVMVILYAFSVGLGLIMDLSKDGSIWGLYTSQVGFFYYFVTIFLCLGIFLVVQFFLPEKEEEVILEIKDKQNYDGNEITYLLFKPAKSQPSYMNTNIPCYTEEDNALVVGYTYRIKVKRYNHQITRILNPDQYAGMERRNDNVGRNVSSEKQVKEQDKLMELGVLSRYDVDPDMCTIKDMYLQSAGITQPTYVDLTDLKMLYIKGSIRKKQGEGVFFLTDDNNRMIFQIRGDYRHPLLDFVSDYRGNPIAMIETKNFMAMNKVVVRMVEDKAFSIQAKLATTVECDVTGSDYKVMGRMAGSLGGTSIYTLDGHMVAEINPGDESFAINTLKVKINQDVILNEELLLLIIGVYMVNSKEN